MNKLVNLFIEADQKLGNGAFAKMTGHVLCHFEQTRRLSAGSNDKEVRATVMMMKENRIFLCIFNIYCVLKVEGPKGEQRVAGHSIQALFSELVTLGSLFKRRRDVEN